MIYPRIKSAIRSLSPLTEAVVLAVGDPFVSFRIVFTTVVDASTDADVGAVVEVRIIQVRVDTLVQTMLTRQKLRKWRRFWRH